MQIQAVIMAGGKGTRLRAITNDEIPKPMAPVAGKPILEWQIECLRRQGIQEIILIIGHLGHKIREYFGDGATFGVKISYIEETEPLGTAASASAPLTASRTASHHSPAGCSAISFPLCRTVLGT